MSKQLHQFLVRLLLEALREQLLRLGNCRVLSRSGPNTLKMAALAGEAPAIDPVADVESAVGAEIAIGASTLQTNCWRSISSNDAPFGLSAKLCTPLPPPEPRKSHRKECF